MENDRVKKDVYDYIKLYLEYKKATLVMPIHILHHELLRFLGSEKGYTSAQINPALNALYKAGDILVGRTINYQYITLPQYVEQVNTKLKARAEQ